MEGTFWALVPPIIAIVLALITKEVYSSLFVGILVGSAFVANFNVMGTLNTIFSDGIVAQLADSYNVGILVFLVFLGIIVSIVSDYDAPTYAAFIQAVKRHSSKQFMSTFIFSALPGFSFSSMITSTASQ